jgi:hypothetical protein
MNNFEDFERAMKLLQLKKEQHRVCGCVSCDPSPRKWCVKNAIKMDVFKPPAPPPKFWDYPLS